MTPDERDRIFFEVFGQLHFPFLAIDLFALGRVLTDQSWNGVSHVAIPVSAASEKRSAVIAAFRAVLRRMDVPPPVVKLFKESPIITQIFKCSDRFDEMVQMQLPAFAVYEKEGFLTLEEQTAWPIAYSTFVMQLHRIYSMFSLALAERTGGAVPDQLIPTIDQTSRVYPTKFHYAAASLGAWAGGAENCQYFSFYAVEPQILRTDQNTKYALKIGYSAEDADNLDKGGFAAIPASLAGPIIEAQGTGVPLFGGINIGEFNIANPPNKVWQPSDTLNANLGGFILDKYYRAPFFAMPPQEQAVYGANNVFRDHYASFYSAISSSDLLRCKHYVIPVIDVSSKEEMASIVASIPIYNPQGLFFRGQQNLHLLERPSKVRSMLFGSGCSTEPSITTQAARKKFDYVSTHFALRYLIEETVLTSAELSNERRSELYDQWLERAISPLCEVDYALMALAQHYGIPTPGLDVTASLDVATWFATNAYVKRLDGKSLYEEITKGGWPAKREKQPVVFVGQVVTHSLGMSLQNCEELGEFGITALRPQRQSALFFHGGHIDHQNRMAESLICAFRLKPGSYATNCSFEELFPPPSEDGAYKLLLELSVRKPLALLGGKEIARYH